MARKMRLEEGNHFEGACGTYEVGFSMPFNFLCLFNISKKKSTLEIKGGGSLLLGDLEF